MSRLKRIFVRYLHLPRRVDRIEQHLDLVGKHLQAIDTRVHECQQQLDALPGYFFLQEGTSSERVDSLVEGVVMDTQARLDSAVQSMRLYVESAMSTLAEDVTSSTRLHTEQAVARSAGVVGDAAREHAESAATAALATARSNGEELVGATRAELLAEIGILRRELATLRRLTTQHAPSPDPSRPAVGGPSTPNSPRMVSAAFYAALEDRFRGGVDIVTDRQRRFLPIVAPLVDHEHPVVDLGCGRGEWLRLLDAEGLPAIGVDTNTAFVAEVGEQGLRVIEQDLLAYLRGCQPASIGAITMFQVLEHLSLSLVLEVMTEGLRVLRPGGAFIAEVPNVLNLTVAASSFWLDPTHERPLHPHLLEFCAEWIGFSRVESLYLNELQPSEPDVHGTFDRIRRMIDGPGDFALVAFA